MKKIEITLLGLIITCIIFACWGIGYGRNVIPNYECEERIND